MNQLIHRLPEPVVAILQAEQIDDSSLVLLTDEHLKNMGITQAGPRIIILNYIDEVKATVVAPKPIAFNSELQVTRAMFESDSDFANKYLYRVLDRDGIPDEQGIHQITKISCKQLVQRAFQNGQRATWSEMQTVAKNVLEVFPRLEATRANANAPPESRFFWLHSGMEHGAHGGTIYHHIRNKMRSLPSDQLKFKRRRLENEEQEEEQIPQEIYERMNMMCTIEPTRANFQMISEEMAVCYPVHREMLQQKRSVNDILTCFPHLLDHSMAFW
nr:uncharacterized protein LOC109418401 [Aedes albopictus]